MQDNCIIPKNCTFDKDGYPRKKFQQKIWRMNRWMWTVVHGTIPEGMVVAHSCNNKGCINTNHFYLTTPQQNSTDAAKDGLYISGKRHPRFLHHVETAAAYQRYVDGESQQKIADDLGISQSSLSARFIRYVRKGFISE